MDWSQLIQNFGIAVAILIFLAFCIISVARWMAPRFDRLMERWLSFIDRLSTQNARIDRLEDKVTTIWEFQMRRAATEAIQKGIGYMNSPLIIDQEAKAWFDELAEKLQAFYASLDKNISDTDLALEIEKKFGDDIVKVVCIPKGLYQGACLLIAAAVAKDCPENKDAVKI